MSAEVRCRFDHAEGNRAAAVELCAFRGQLEARALADVPAVIADAEAAARQGWLAAGFVAYEAAPAFDHALQVRSSDPRAPGARLPLAWFGLFAESRATTPLPRAGAGASIRSEPPDGRDEPPPWSPETDAATHGAHVEAIREAIAAGDTYLVNYTTRFRKPWSDGEDPFALYRRLVAGHSTGHHAYIETADWAVACGSPELFFELEGGHLTTRPMKGTAPRGRWPEEDRRQAETLRRSCKERAENIMVVDLLRNDLGRVAVPGTVAVPERWHVERHPTLWQLTSTVTATARADVAVSDVFAALFPCGSVTGAPKVAAMGVISDLERSPRGVYCGAVGLIQAGPESGGAGGVSAHFAVAIRTAVVDKRHAIGEYGSGGGITWDSSAGAEWGEVLVKTKALTGTPAVPGAGEGLVETMGFSPPSHAHGAGGVHNLRRHLARLTSSAEYFGMPCPAGVEDEIDRAVAGLAGPARLRLVYCFDGTVHVEATPLSPDETHTRPLILCIDPEPVMSADPSLFHKSTDRRRYDDRARRHPGADDVVLVNERGEVTETTRASLAVLIGGRWWTPPLDCGLLPGVARAELLAAGRLAERIVTVDELRGADEVATLSSLRGWRPARLQLQCRC